ncbi:hypothetical protein ACIQPP_45895 [Streptomyces violaceusniger]|uniref:hypothetical protein n=1 Tax=Streptomyces violaceusniger TaxID=68280 RepID=UPI001396B6E7
MADVPVGGRPVVFRLRVRRLVCPVLACGRRTFREQLAVLLERHQRRTVRIAVLPGRDAATYGILAARASWC